MKPMLTGSIIGVCLFVLSLIFGWFIALGAIKKYLQSEDFNTLIAGEASKVLRADATLEQVSWNGQASSVFVRNFEATGYEDSAFSTLRIHGFEANFQLTLGHIRECIRDGAWKIPSIVVNKLEFEFDEKRQPGTWEAAQSRATGPAVAVAPEPEPKPESAAPKKRSLLERLLPQDVEFDNIHVRGVDLLWRDAGKSHRVAGMSLLISPAGADDVYKIVSPAEMTLGPAQPNGYIDIAGLPRLEVQKLNFRCNPKSKEFFVDHGAATTLGGTLDMNGEMTLGDESDLNLTANLLGVDLHQFIPEDWQKRFLGTADVRATIEGDFDNTQTHGNIEINQGVIQAIPALDTLAEATKTERFRRIALNTASANFSRNNEQLLIHDIFLQSDGLGRLQGSLGVEEGERLDGELNFGVVPGVFRFQLADYLQAKLFKDVRDNHHWTKIKIKGTVAEPRHDLDEQLIAAVQGAAGDVGEDLLKLLIDPEGADLENKVEDLAKDLLKGIFGN
ncbi:MAG: hypothetical protein ACI8UO_002412 [Verrucomicrobiales bacterium]|jgi:hypothetical protein